MLSTTIADILTYARETREVILPRERPWGIWVAQHETVSDLFFRPIATVPVRAWFLYQQQSAVAADLWSYLRFFTVQRIQPWNTLMHGELYRDRRIAAVAFAPTADARVIRLESFFQRSNSVSVVEGFLIHLNELGHIASKQQWGGGMVHLTWYEIEIPWLKAHWK